MREKWLQARPPVASLLVRLVAFAPALSIGALLAIAAGRANGETVIAGLTGTNHPDDVVMARQLVMDSIDTDMGAMEAAIAGSKIDLAGLKDRAYRISTLLSAFPHLFPPETKPTPDLSTSATPAVWQDFDGFYDKVQDAAGMALDASQASDAAKLASGVKSLRAACDSCHAVYMHVAAP